MRHQHQSWLVRRSRPEFSIQPLAVPCPCPKRRLARLQAARAALTPARHGGGGGLPRDELAEVIEELSHSTILLDKVKKDLDGMFGRLRRMRQQLAAAFPQHAVAPPRVAPPDDDDVVPAARRQPQGGQQRQAEESAEGERQRQEAEEEGAAGEGGDSQQQAAADEAPPQP